MIKINKNIYGSGSLKYGEMETEVYNDLDIYDEEEIVMEIPSKSLDEPHTVLKIKEEKKKWNPNIMAMIDSQNFNKEKLSISSSLFQSMVILTPFYQYSPKTQEPLHIQTNFLNIEKNSFIYKEFQRFHNDDKGFVMRILPELFDSTTLNIFLEYDRQITKFINNKNLKCTDKLIYNKEIEKHQPEYQNDPIMQMDFGPIKFKLSKKMSKVTNYNISKKYPKEEEFNGTKNKSSEFFGIFDRILSDKKQVRFVFSPMTWVRNNQYGSYMIIQNMEIKYKGANISSALDKESKTMHDEITSIVI